MNTTISRIAASAPVAVALLGFSFGSAQAAPYDPSSADKVQMQPADKPGWDIDLPISDDLPDGDPPAPPDDIADPVDEPADEESDEDETDENADDETNGSGNGTNSSNGGSKGSDKAGTNEDGDEAEQAPIEAADVPFTPASASGVQVPPELVAAAGAALAGVVGWAGYRRMKANA